MVCKWYHPYHPKIHSILFHYTLYSFPQLSLSVMYAAKQKSTDSAVTHDIYNGIAFTHNAVTPRSNYSCSILHPLMYR